MIVLLKGDKSLVAQARRDKVESSTLLLFGRYASDLKSVTLRLTKVIAPDGSPSKRCQVAVSITPKRVLAEHVDASLAVALERASNKAARSIARVLQRAATP